MDANMNNDTPTYSQDQLPCQEECIITAKIYDQCRLREYIKLGPAISNENCVCTVVHPMIVTQTFGNIICPGEPIRLPKWVKQIKYVKNSFQTRSVTILSINPSLIKKGYWDVNIRFVFDFELKLYGNFLTPIEIICQTCGDNSTTQSENRKNFLRCSVSFETKVTLSGPKDSPFISSDLLPQQPYAYPGAPHAFVETWAEPIDFKLVKPDESGCYQDLFDDTYHEPFQYIYACIAILAHIKLFGFACLGVEAKKCPCPKNCPHFDEDPCEYFSDMPFPTELFQP